MIEGFMGLALVWLAILALAVSGAWVAVAIAKTLYREKQK